MHTEEGKARIGNRINQIAHETRPARRQFIILPAKRHNPRLGSATQELGINFLLSKSMIHDIRFVQRSLMAMGRGANKSRWRSLRAGALRLVSTKPPPWLPVAATAIPAVLLLVQIVQNWINIPYWDEWRLIAQLRISMQAGTLGPLDLFAQHNDSRFVLPHLLFLPLARLTHWDLRAEMLSIFATACLISWVLWGLLGKIENLSRPARVVCLWFATACFFRPYNTRPGSGE